MAKASFENYGNTKFIEPETRKFADFNDVQGGGASVDAYGDMEKKEKDSIDMNAGEAFNKKDYTKVDAMGSDYAKKGKSNQMNSNKGDHFSTDTDNSDIDAYGTEEAKPQSYQSGY